MNDLTGQFTDVEALVLGDVMLDRYLEGEARRISPEAPVPVVSLSREWCAPGGAGHVAALLAGLSCRVTVGSSIGSSVEGDLLKSKLLEAGVYKLVLAEGTDLDVICKTRILARGHQQMLRLDRDGNREGFLAASAKLQKMILPLICQSSVVVIADYDKGTLPPALIREIIRDCRASRCPCVIDPKKVDLSTYTGATILTPNIHEVERALGCSLDRQSAVASAAVELRKRLELDYMLITQGSDGMTLASSTGHIHLLAEVREVADVTGAGDTVVAALAASLAVGWDINEACRLASVAAGLAVSKMGTYVVHAEELGRVWAGKSPKILGSQAAQARVARAREAGQRVIFTNGCFDILHAGHLSCLNQAKKLGDLLVVGLNSDSSVRLNKGVTRPIIEQDMRASLLAGLTCVDLVVIFDEESPEALIHQLNPDVLVKGGDYSPESIAGSFYIRNRGGEVVIIPLIEGLSTTSILRSGSPND
jgi:D-beta-D-heptose 7-phosphate kinase/D-beta-D-heptose 1-phosphate adenosyltransferase